jgi:pimeloyl-ACP methyl ester carboxylesterase
MKQNIINIPPKNIHSLNINGMRGRYINIISDKHQDRNILLIYGHHSSLERMYSLASYLVQYGNVIMPDLPGFGDMDTFYKINKKPTIDNMADYLASFIKLKYKNKKFAVCGMSYGFLVVTRMLQKYPELNNQIQLTVSLVGFADKSDFAMSRGLYSSLKFISKALSIQPFNYLAQYVLFSKVSLYISYKLSASRHPKMKDASKEEFNKRVRFEYYLWRCNDVRTYAYSLNEMLRVNLTNYMVNNNLHHIYVTQDQYLNQKKSIKSLSKIYKRVYTYQAKLPNHAPTVIASTQEAGAFIPQKLRAKLKGSAIWK